MLLWGRSDMFKPIICFLIFTGCGFSVDASTLHYKNKNDFHRKVVLDQTVLPKEKQGKIIFVTGSCSAGKSSMAKEIAQKLNAKSFAFDEYVMPLILKKFVTKHYGKFLAFFVSGLVMRNFFTAMNFLSEKSKYKFQKKFYNDLKHGMAIEPTLKMYREVKNVALSGKNVVVESPLHLWDGVDFLSCLSEFDKMDITYVLAFCPWNDLIDRIKQRNSYKNKKTHRELDWVVINYMYSFDISPDYKDKHLLESLNGRDVHKVISEYLQPKYKREHMRLLSETQNVALQKFPKDIGYYVYPRFDYNIIVNTKTNNPEQGANIVLDYIRACK
jgi:deoxyadenosine/deoxycytidine kinase